MSKVPLSTVFFSFFILCISVNKSKAQGSFCLSSHLFLKNLIFDNKIKQCPSPNLLSVNDINLSATKRCQRSVDKIFSKFDDWLLCSDQSLQHFFPIDSNKNCLKQRQVSNSVFSYIKPTPMTGNLELAGISDSALFDCLDLSNDVRHSDIFIDFVNGNNQSGLFPPALAHRYGGHQFGYWAGQLGDGRAALVLDYVNSKGEIWELQLKGSGKTPYSRQGDGRAVIRSSVREFLASEAMFHLGIPTSRAAALLVSTETVLRDQFYDGHSFPERTAIVLRLAKSWFRIGSFEILAESGETDLLKKLVDYVIKRFFAHISDGKYRLLEFFQAVVKGTAEMIAHWQSIGFAHGVCNTDNFSILSITIDYGPFGFLDKYDSQYVPNTSDDESRYSFEKQPDVGYYNMEKLLRSLTPLFENDTELRSSYSILERYAEYYKLHYLLLMMKKFGISGCNIKRKKKEMLTATFLKILDDTKGDYTMSFRQLGEIELENILSKKSLTHHWALKYISTHTMFEKFISLYKNILIDCEITDLIRRQNMNKVNPVYVLRNWIAQRAISETENGNYKFLKEIQKILSNPYVRQEDAEKLGYSNKPPHWAAYLKVSCSS